MARKSGVEPGTPAMPVVRTLIIDNYDSYTMNLYQYCCNPYSDEKSASEPLNETVVIFNDQLSWESLCDILPYFQQVVISPGPGRPDREEDFGVCEKLLQEGRIPVLGVCLGHQGIAAAHGGKVVHAPKPVHGRLSPVVHAGSGLFAEIPSPVNVVRYHSLIVSERDLPSDFQVTAWTLLPDGNRIVMGLEHVSKPLWGVQFHPESICTDHGRKFIRNLFDMTVLYWNQHDPNRLKASAPLPSHISNLTSIPSPLVDPAPRVHASSQYRIRVHRISGLWVQPQVAFDGLFGSKEDVSRFWLDSAKVEKKRSRFSFMGSGDGPRSFSVRFSNKSRTLSLRHPQRRASEETIELPNNQTFFQWLAQKLESYGLDCLHSPEQRRVDAVECKNGKVIGSLDKLPFIFLGGMVGYFGYEMKSESFPSAQQFDASSQSNDVHKSFQHLSAEDAPDAAFVFADRMVVFDHEEGTVYVTSMVESSPESDMLWLSETEAFLRQLSLQQNGVSKCKSVPDSTQILRIAHPRETYIDNISQSLEKIRDGETYEVCLTTRISTEFERLKPSAPYEFYKILRRRNPAPYGAFIDFGPPLERKETKGRLVLASSSPERFLRVDEEGWVSMKPIKGTVARAIKRSDNAAGGEALEIDVEEDERRRKQLGENEKDRSENLMIVDLIRNDLNAITERDTVAVPELMVVESYATVHQLVSTIRGRLRVGLTHVDAVMRSFPPGSMTGAPKRRTVEILEQLEGVPRGPYSGVLGFLSLTGACDMSVIIRTAVFSEDGKVSIGAGGAIITLSDPSAEYDEMLLKANSVLPRFDA
ncbi:ADC synthase [Cladochytrium replicatum]|nr:ADC synthase [Cladochytrium replicatum]